MKVINKYISVSDKSQNDTGEIYIYGDISDNKWFDEDVTPKEIRDALNGLGQLKTIDIHLNSYGGSCVAGNAIINILDSYRRKNNASINVYIEGIAASMGSGIASIGDTVYMAENSLFMVHKPLCMAVGNADDFAKTIELLDKTEQTLLSNYMRRFKGTEDELKQMLSDETWLTADEAKEWGFADEIISGVKIAASANGIKIGNQLFEKEVSDLIKNKLPNITLEKEAKTLTYDEKLKDFGITQEMFASLNIESEKILEVIDIAKDALKPEPVADFIGKEEALKELGCDDITAEEVFAYAKIGMNPKDTKEIEDKASKYEKVVATAREEAKTAAIKAQGETYNESLVEKFLNVLDYDDIVAQTKIWNEEAKKQLHAGQRVSARESCFNNGAVKEKENLENYKI